MRELTSGFKAAIAAGQVRVGLLCEINYPDLPVRAWTGIGDLEWNSKTWKGVGDFGSVSAIQEKTGPQAGNIKIGLSGVLSSMRALALENSSANCITTVWLAAFEETEGVWSVIDDPWKPFSGITDVHRIAASTIEVNVETWLARLKRAKISRYTHQEQQRRFPTDLGLEYAGDVAIAPFYFGSATPLGMVQPVPRHFSQVGNS